MATSRKQTIWILQALFGVFFFGGAGLGWLLFGRAILAANAARDWVETDCVILSGKLDQERMTKGARTYTLTRIEVTYRYTVEGKEYTGERYDFSVGRGSGNFNAKFTIAQQLKAGNEDTCFVNPADASESVLRKSTGLYGDDKVLAFVPVVFMALGFLGAVSVVIATKTRFKLPAQSPAV